jgi:hypothetical protein
MDSRQREVRQMASGGQSTNLLLESAARSLAAGAAKGSNSAVVAASTATPPLVDVDGKEHSGFLEKKKAAENLPWSSRQLSDAWPNQLCSIAPSLVITSKSTSRSFAVL